MGQSFSHLLPQVPAVFRNLRRHPLLLFFFLYSLHRSLFTGTIYGEICWILYYSFLKLPLSYLLERLFSATGLIRFFKFYKHKYTFRQQLVVGIFKHAFYHLPLPSIQNVLNVITKLNHLVHRPVCSPFQHPALPVSGLWYGDADISDNLRVILYFHGGGYCIGNAGMYPYAHNTLVKDMTRHAPTRVLSIDYRLAPEHPFPAALEDAVAAYDHLIHDLGIIPHHIIIAGDSAGGGLALATALKIRDRIREHEKEVQAQSTQSSTTTLSHKRMMRKSSDDEMKTNQPAGICLISPWVDLSTDALTLYQQSLFETDKQKAKDMKNTAIQLIDREYAINTDTDYLPPVKILEFANSYVPATLQSISAQVRNSTAAAAQDEDSTSSTAPPAPPLMVTPCSCTVDNNSTCGQVEPSNPLVSPLLADLTELPPVLVCYGGKEIFTHTQCAPLLEQLSHAQNNADSILEDNFPHIFPLLWEGFGSDATATLLSISEWMTAQLARARKPASESMLKRNLFSTTSFL